MCRYVPPDGPVCASFCARVRWVGSGSRVCTEEAPTDGEANGYGRFGDAGPVEVSEPQFTRVGDDASPTRCFGEGTGSARGGVIETVDVQWERPPTAHFLRRPASFYRLSFNRRGPGARIRCRKPRGGVPEGDDPLVTETS